MPKVGSTLLNEVGFNCDWIEKCFAHVDGRSSCSVYNKAEYAATFPAPVHEGSASIWHLAEVLGWLEEKGGYAFERKMLETARAALQVNLAKEVHRLPVAAARELKLLIA